MAKYSNSPRRRIERIRSVIIDTSVAGTEEEFILHSAEDAKTLIRAWGQLSISPIDTAMVTTVLFSGKLSIHPNSQKVTGPTVTQSLDGNTPLQELGSWYADAMQNDTNGLITTDKIEFDMKAQRKMKAGDEVVWSHLASTASDLRCRGVIYLWFKE